jgi:hypothetical protein
MWHWSTAHPHSARTRELVQPEYLGGQQHQPGIDPHRQSGHDRIGQCASDDPVDVIQPVLQDGHAHADWQRDDSEAQDIQR